MAQIFTKRLVTPHVSNRWSIEEWWFDTVTQTDDFFEYSTFSFNAPAQSFELNPGQEVWSVCGPTVADPNRARTTRTLWTYAGQPRGTTTVQAIPNSPICGFVPPATLLCRILIPRVTVAGTTATVTTADATGVVEYRLLDQRGQEVRPRQTSNEFAGLAPGIYTVEAYDTGSQVPGCKAVSQFTIAVQSSGVATLAPLPALAFAGNPLLVRATASLAGRPVLLRVYLETEHGSNNYFMAYEAVRATNDAGVATLDVHDLLRGHLSPELHEAAGWHQLTRPIRRWYVSVCEVINGTLGRLNTSPYATVVLGGLPPEVLQEGLDFFSNLRTNLGFMSWQPLEKRVGAQHREVLQVLHRTDDPPILKVTHNPIGTVPALAEDFPHPLVVAATAPGAADPGDAADVPEWQLSQFIYLVPDSAPASSRLRLQLRYPGSGLVLNRRRTLDIERDPLIEPRQLVYENSLGGFDTMACFGQLTAKLSTEQQVVTRYEPVGEVATARDMSWPAGSNRPTMALATGGLTPAWLEYLQELLKPGREVYEVVGRNLRPIVLSTREIITYQDNNDQPYAVLEYRSAYGSNYFADYARNTNRDQDATAGR